MGDYLSADAILAFDDVQVRDVDVPEWEGVVRLRSLSGRELDAYQASMRERDGDQLVVTTENSRAKLVGRCAIDPETGVRLFNDAQIHQLGNKNAAVLDRLWDVAAELSGLLATQRADDLGDSVTVPTTSSGSTSPES